MLAEDQECPGQILGEAVKTAVYLLNRAPTKSLNRKTPYEAWFGRKPGVKHLRTFGCVAYVKKLGPGITKLSDRSVPGVFLEYEPGTKGYRVYDPSKGRLMITRDVIFDEKKAWNWGEKNGETREGEAVPFTFTVQNQDTAHDPTIGQDATTSSETVEGGGLSSPAASISSRENIGDVDTSPHTPVSSATGPTQPTP